MFRRRTSIAAFLIAVAALALTPTEARRSLPRSWDGLVQVDVRGLRGVRVLPGADFQPFTKVMIDPVEVSFRENWQREYNNTTRGLNGRVRNSDVQRIIETAQTGFNDVFANAYRNAGFQVVTAGRRRAAREDSRGQRHRARHHEGRQRVYSQQAGSATLVLETHDTTTGAILGRVVDPRAVGDTSVFWVRNRATNTNDFRRVFRSWADASVNALRTLQAQSPVSVATK